MMRNRERSRERRGRQGTPPHGQTGRRRARDTTRTEREGRTAPGLRTPSKQCNTSAPGFSGLRHTTPTNPNPSTTSTALGSPGFSPSPLPPGSLTRRCPAQSGPKEGPCPFGTRAPGGTRKGGCRGPRPCEGMGEGMRHSPDPLGHKAPLAVLGVLSWLNCTPSGYRRERAGDDMFSRHDGGNREAPPGVGSPET